MEQSTAQRRLVKSPPELWAEVSSEVSLGRHLAEFGVIRITRAEYETTVAWEGDRASGTVELAPTGWGTKVILTVTPSAEPATAALTGDVEPRAAAGEPRPVRVQPAEPAEPAEPAAPAAAAAAEPAPEPDAVQPAPEPATIDTTADPPPAAPASPAAQAPKPKRRWFFARLFRRRAKPSAAPPPALEIPAPPAPAPDPSPPTPGPDPSPPDPGPAPTAPPVPDPVPPDPSPVPGPVPGPDPMPPSIQAPALDAERIVAILTEVLDDLGAAHRQPSFSFD